MTTITLAGMSCDPCEQTVEEAVRDVGGVTAATVDREAKQVDVDSDADIEEVLRATEDPCYNVFALPLATGVLGSIGVLLSPPIGAVFISLSTVIVAINARRLRGADLA